MTRNGPDDATRKGSVETAEIEGLLAFAATRRGKARLNVMSEAIAKCRALVRKSPGQHEVLLAHCLRTSSRMLLDERRLTQALPAAQEAVALTRRCGGPPLAAALMCLGNVLEALNRFSEAAAAMAEADAVIGKSD
ncbi:hypothetical protein MF672_027080 [Actinomadura sp. ATCC 31491]|uniref:Tetratricopeptide repeat protein n=1 Tax=Actinomadura luzonensis TaxID=2805427 RepID=A0ABT0FZP2_9ACTN|nr:hypothetical protein [Actinomadura luzonensis]MCK2217425.1 hypothetical protein [Actinomadura luzonensis]